MNIYAITCTRESKFNDILSELNSYLTKNQIKHKIMVGEKSIFNACENGVKWVKDQDTSDPILILCHDDIKILMDGDDLKKTLKHYCSNPAVGFVGAAGTSYLDHNAVWWHGNKGDRGPLRGIVYHGLGLTSKETYPTFFGQAGPVVVMDGIFMAARLSVWESIQLKRPEEFVGLWDYYDIFYSIQTFLAKKTNIVANIPILHNSKGELVGRESWAFNRGAFIKMYPILPASC